MRYLHIGGFVRTNIDIDDRLIREAMKRSGSLTKRATVEAALRLLVKTHSQTVIRRLKGSVQWQGDLHDARKSRIRD